MPKGHCSEPQVTVVIRRVMSSKGHNPTAFPSFFPERSSLLEEEYRLLLLLLFFFYLFVLLCFILFCYPKGPVCL